MNGCGTAQASLESPYNPYAAEAASFTESDQEASYFAEDLCVTDTEDFGTDQTDSQVAEGAGVFNVTTNEVCYAQNLYGKLYPASTTKILTAYIIISNCDVSDMVTVSVNAVDQAEDSSVCNLEAGDVISVNDLLYGLLLASGNDAAVALAEYYSGSTEAFADEMNRVAQDLGATNSHFMNPNGLPDEEHYTTVYDMYLIFKEAIKLDKFVEVISAANHTASFTNATGGTVSKTWNNTNRYLAGTVSTPDDFTIIGGKTGTTGAAGYCLVLYSQNDRGDDIISIVFKADGRSNLYLLMNEMLTGFAN